jgi:hypothetical protein
MQYEYQLLDLSKEKEKFKDQIPKNENAFVWIINHYGKMGWEFVPPLEAKKYALFQYTTIDEAEKVKIISAPEPSDKTSGIPFEII